MPAQAHHDKEYWEHCQEDYEYYFQAVFKKDHFLCRERPKEKRNNNYFASAPSHVWILHFAEMSIQRRGEQDSDENWLAYWSLRLLLISLNQVSEVESQSRHRCDPSNENCECMKLSYPELIDPTTWFSHVYCDWQ